MRELATKEKIEQFMRAFGKLARTETAVYFTGGSTAVIEGWRDTTLDLDIKFDPELDELFRGIPSLKETLKINVELAAPSDFIPELPGWRDRSAFIATEGKASFYNYDLYSQALAKIERGHDKDMLDVHAMFDRGLVEREKLLSFFHQIEPFLYKYPAIDQKDFAASVARIVKEKG